MKIDLLRIHDLRCFDAVEFQPGPGSNWLIGANGAGKTTVLEAAYLLSHGRSFRSGGKLALPRQGEREYVVHAQLSDARGASTRVGLERDGEQWRARLNGNSLASLGPLFGACPVVCFEPESHNLIVGPAELRRAFLDWSVFHVEHTSWNVWRSWRRALRQRNALLRSSAADAQFEPWERELGKWAQLLHASRAACLDSLEPYLRAEAAKLVPELGTMRLAYRPGWDVAVGLAQQLRDERTSDRERGYTWHGAHRADWNLAFSGIASREHFSRGQAKAVALVCTLALAEWLGVRLGDYPLMEFDDLTAELDQPHVELVLDWLAQRPVQAWLTATRAPSPAWLGNHGGVFHVEHKSIRGAEPEAPGNATL